MKELSSLENMKIFFEFVALFIIALLVALALYLISIISAEEATVEEVQEISLSGRRSRRMMSYDEQLLEMLK
jgi:flagellar biogenesis protein FliO